MRKIKVTIWNEYVHEQSEGPLGDYIRKIYPRGIHEALREALQADDLEIRTATLDMPEQGLPDSLLNDTDVLLWWGHCAHGKVDDALVDRIQFRVLHGMGLIVLHSGHMMYGERFDIPDDGKIVFMSWYEGGNVFRSGVAFQRDYGKIFYFSPGHESYPIYHDVHVQKVLANAIRWAAPADGVLPDRVTPQPEAPEKITTENPLRALDTSEIHKIQ